MKAELRVWIDDPNPNKASLDEMMEKEYVDMSKPPPPKKEAEHPIKYKTKDGDTVSTLDDELRKIYNEDGTRKDGKDHAYEYFEESMELPDDYAEDH